MPLVLSAANRLLLSSAVLKPGGRGIFVPTTEQNHPPGTTVQVVVQIADERLGTALEGQVLTTTAVGPGGQAGLYLSLSDEQQARAHDFLDQPDNGELLGRAEVRVDCQLPLRLVQPVVAQTFHTRNLSRSGLLASCEAPLEAGQLVHLAVELNPDQSLDARARVAWVRPELSLVGLRFEGLTSQDTARLDTVVEALRKVPEPKAAGSGPPESKDPSRPDVLVADDEPAVLLFISRALNRLGLKVATFERGDLALQAVRTLKPRLVMLDVLMPGMDGLQVCSLIRKDAMMTDLPVVLLSALDREKIKKIAEEARATGWLQKPLTIASLRKAITEHLKLAGGVPG